MMKYIIIGTTPFSSVIKNIIIAEGGNVVAYSTARELISQEVFDGLPVIPTEDILEHKLSDEFRYINTIGYSRMNDIRKRVFLELEKNGIPVSTYISTKAMVYTDQIGSGCIIMPGAFVGPDVIIGKSNVIYSNASLTHHINMGDYNFIGSGCVIGGSVEIGNNCFFGLNSTIRNRIKISDYTLLSSNANAIKSTIHSGGVLMGNPARIVDGKSSIETKI